MNTRPEQQLEALLRWLRGFGSALVAFSGGVDSAVVLAAAHRAMGGRALGCIGTSPSYPRRELDSAVQLAQQLGAAYRLIQTEEHLDPRYAVNAGDRCFYCKNDLYTRLAQLARDEDFAVVLDGTNLSDTGDHRPGRAAAQQQGVRSPLVELGVDKAGVRALAKLLNLPVWDKPAMACLSSRVPTGSAITVERLSRIERAEDVLVALGFRQFRVRDHETLARVELPAEDLRRAVELRDTIVAPLRGLGYSHVCLDLAGFRREDAAGGGQDHPHRADTVTLTVHRGDDEPATGSNMT